MLLPVSYFLFTWNICNINGKKQETPQKIIAILRNTRYNDSEVSIG